MNFRIFAIRCYQWLMTLFGTSRVPLSRSRPNAVMMLNPDYGNIGDLAIGYAQEQFLRGLDRFEVHSVTVRNTYHVLRSLRRELSTDDVVILVGGGNMGDLYPRAQLGREYVARFLQHKRIISFPQSIIYRPGPQREKAMRREAAALSRSARWLTLFAREQESLDHMRSFFPGDVGYAPDIVLSLISRFRNQEPRLRSGAVLALRKDSESAFSERDHQVIRAAVAHHGIVTELDHGVPDHHVDLDAPEELALAALETYRRASVVVTDRLHGMIFAAITGTPCVVLPNTNHKVTGTYQDWIAPQCRFIRLVSRPGTREFDDALSAATTPEAVRDYAQIRFDFTELSDALLQPKQLGRPVTA